MELKVNEKFHVMILGQENSGMGYTKLDGFVVFVENGLTGDAGQISITEIKKNYARGQMVVFDKMSDERVLPPCPYYDKCGGCQLQHQDYESQLEFKEKKIKIALEHIGNLKDINIDKIIPSTDYNYRNKVTLRVEKDKLGFYQHDSNILVEIDKCIICDEEINEVIKYIKKYIIENPSHNMDMIMIRHSNYNNEIMLSISSIGFYNKKEFINYMTSKMHNIKTIIIDNKTVHGSGYITEKIDNLLFQISPLSFFQINTLQTEKLYQTVIDAASLSEDDIALDLYCGTGTITALLSKHCKKVIGIEVEEDAIRNAKDNMAINRVNNVEFILGKVENCITKLEHKKIDVIVMDPPRKGSDIKTLNIILKISPKKIIYVSCSPTTLARDLRYLTDNSYMIEKVIPVDMFPQTEHVECVVKLYKK